MNAGLRKMALDSYYEARADVFAMFIDRGFTLAVPNGWSAMVTMQSWMFLSSYQGMRRDLLKERTIQAMVHMGNMVMGIAFGTAATIWRNSFRAGAQASFNFVSTEDLNDSNEPKSFPILNDRLRAACADEFTKIPGYPIAYQASEAERNIFARHSTVNDSFDPRQGMATGDNAKFVRDWFEVAKSRSFYLCPSKQEAFASGCRWFPYNKGGSFMRWYGNHEDVVAFDDASYSLLKNQGNHCPSEQRYFVPNIGWSKISSSLAAFRLYPQGFIFDVAGCSIFQRNAADSLNALAGFLNSVVAKRLLSYLSPTLNFEVGTIKQLPLAKLPADVAVAVDCIVETAVALSRVDWDNFETSWNFHDFPLIREETKGQALEESWRNWEVQCRAAIRRMQELEMENNRLFISAYELIGELQPEVPEEQITLTRAEARRDITSFLSYATGCMMGRYSLDQPGLILADPRASQVEQLAAYEAKVGKSLSEVQFYPDPDGIIPVLDGEWFEDDIVARTREFLEVTFPESSVAENLRFIEESLGKDIRKYFCSEFYKDHLQTYKKRPIYWLVQSPKKGFACLIYLHRYTKDTLNLVLNNYFRPYLQKLEARLAQLGLDQLNDDLPTRDRTAARKEAEKITKVLKECQAWEQDALLPRAQQRIELDLDDGVKVNYLKLQDVLAPIPGLAAKEE